MEKPWENGDLCGKSPCLMGKKWDFYDQWIGLREILQESPIFNEKIYGFL